MTRVPNSHTATYSYVYVHTARNPILARHSHHFFNHMRCPPRISLKTPQSTAVYPLFFPMILPTAVLALLRRLGPITRAQVLLRSGTVAALALLLRYIFDARLRQLDDQSDEYDVIVVGGGMPRRVPSCVGTDAPSRYLRVRFGIPPK